MTYIKVRGIIYNQIGMYGGYVYLGKPTDVNNDVLYEGLIWEMQPFLYESEFSKVDNLKLIFYNIVRFFKVDVFGKSDFKTFCQKIW
jgi:hypothetical protein